MINNLLLSLLQKNNYYIYIFYIIKINIYIKLIIKKWIDETEIKLKTKITIQMHIFKYLKKKYNNLGIYLQISKDDILKTNI